MQKRLILVSNRVSVPGSPIRAGGLEVVLAPIVNKVPTVWFGWSGNISDENNIQTITKNNSNYVTMDLSQTEYEEYYNGFANQVIWPLFHYRNDLTEFKRHELQSYYRVNVKFADELLKIINNDDIIWVHDYHLIPLAHILRQRGIKNKIGYFHHIPFPVAEVVEMMPAHKEVITCLLEYDLIGFQTGTDATNFRRYLDMIHMLCDSVIGVFPVSIDVNMKFNGKSLLNTYDRKVIIGVDRLDYTKGLLRRMKAFELFYETNKDWHDKVTYIQIAPPSRTHITEYKNLSRNLSHLVGEINSKHGDISGNVVRYTHKSYSRSNLIKIYREAHVGLVTPLRDGMNLVAKEYVVAQRSIDPGVLVLSKFAGAAFELKGSVMVNPYDIDAVAAAIKQALEMPLEERLNRHEQNMSAILNNCGDMWAEKFLKELERAAGIEPAT